MAVLHHRRRHYLSTLAAFTFLLFFSSSSATFSQLDNNNNSGFQENEEGQRVSELSSNPTPTYNDRVLVTQKRLGGPGSSPPTCRSKCSRCSPCKPVHVPIQPGLSMPLEYYPEAWRCKCVICIFHNDDHHHFLPLDKAALGM
ncbi:EPIDERMAL PATTERNING FACTOR-like protein 5 [Mercurialis annua]|uniref:EPIDERMAL PATTERNING FACTOR-like protein 5 n=1 Tax=Mercurialis annua TaxID=3986 RepID=UPI0021607C5B|nr:EPIDERMAL PATTERNING FACTOR-like protein 5 [Mercurialis annua]XP_050215888.1 EPIDERMAL PATTERNING FACTOR-like protein 5 [Mercurialis annua]